jgi:hypothetical protein
MGELAHHNEALQVQVMKVCRCSSDRSKDKRLTWGGLLMSSTLKEKSAEVIVFESNEPSPKWIKMEDSRFNEGLNIKKFQML